MPTQAERFASCVKKVAADFRPSMLTKARCRTVKKRYTAAEKEGIAVAICTKSILWPQGRTIRRFYMKDGKAKLITQKKKATVQKSVPPKK